MLKLSLLDLNLIEAIAESGTLTGAGRQLHVTQPAVSQRLSSLTDRMGVALVERREGRTLLTPAGERLLQSAHRIGDELAAAAHDIDSLASEQALQLRVATQCYTCYRWLPFVLSRMRDDFPMLNVDVVPEATDTPYEALARNDIDVAIVSNPQAGHDVDEAALFNDELFAVLHVSHPLEKHRLIGSSKF